MELNPEKIYLWLPTQSKPMNGYHILRLDKENLAKISDLNLDLIQHYQVKQEFWDKLFSQISHLVNLSNLILSYQLLPADQTKQLASSLAKLEHLENFEVYLCCDQPENKGIAYFSEIISKLKNIKKISLTVVSNSTTGQLVEDICKNLSTSSNIVSLQLHFQKNSFDQNQYPQILVQDPLNIVNSNDNTTLNLQKNEIPILEAEQISFRTETLQNLMFVYLNLKGCLISDKNLQQIALDLTKVSINLQDLDLNIKQNTISGQGVVFLFTELSKLQNLNKLTLNLNKIKLSAEEMEIISSNLSMIINLQYLSLNLKKSYINNASSNQLSSSIALLPKLQSIVLKLKYNNIDLSMIQFLATALKKSDNLRSLQSDLLSHKSLKKFFWRSNPRLVVVKSFTDYHTPIHMYMSQ